MVPPSTPCTLTWERPGRETLRVTTTHTYTYTHTHTHTHHSPANNTGRKISKKVRTFFRFCSNQFFHSRRPKKRRHPILLQPYPSDVKLQKSLQAWWSCALLAWVLKPLALEPTAEPGNLRPVFLVLNQVSFLLLSLKSQCVFFSQTFKSCPRGLKSTSILGSRNGLSTAQKIPVCNRVRVQNARAWTIACQQIRTVSPWMSIQIGWVSLLDEYPNSRCQVSWILTSECNFQTGSCPLRFLLLSFWWLTCPTCVPRVVVSHLGCFPISRVKSTCKYPDSWFMVLHWYQMGSIA